MRANPEVFIEKAFIYNDVRVFVVLRNADGTTDVMDPPTFRRHDPGTFDNKAALEPGAAFSNSAFLQAIVDAAWKEGIRPAGYVDGDEGRLSATRSHLDDMRAIAFQQLGMERRP